LVTAPVKGRKSFICFDEDATVKSVKQAIDKGFDVPELVKRFAGVGLGPGQGGIPGHNLPLFVAKYTASINTPVPTTVRPPLVPTFLATYAGYNHHMFKRTPLHDSQKADGGIFRNIGVWQRARYFSEDFDCKEEILNVRNNVGMLDGSTLGKFRIHGPDALKALQRVYVSDMSKVKEGRIKYSAMCNDDGCVIDDGVVVKLGENDYYFTTSTGRAGQTVEWIRYHTRFDGWDFSLVNLTDAMGVINISGPNTRKVLAKVLDIDLSNDAFPFSGYREFTIKDTIFVRAMRLGFVGELFLRAARSLILHAGGLGHAQGSRSRIRHPQLRRGSPERAAHGKMPRHPRLRVRTAHQPAGPGPGLSLGPQESRCQDRWCRGPAPG
jgi:sarcosine oxidase subunit alpha